MKDQAANESFVTQITPYLVYPLLYEVEAAEHQLDVDKNQSSSTAEHKGVSINRLSRKVIKAEKSWQIVKFLVFLVYLLATLIAN